MSYNRLTSSSVYLNYQEQKWQINIQEFGLALCY